MISFPIHLVEHECVSIELRVNSYTRPWLRLREFTDYAKTYTPYDEQPVFHSGKSVVIYVRRLKMP